MQPIASQATGWLATAIQLLAQAGLRMGEVLALLVGDIDFDQEKLRNPYPLSRTCLDLDPPSRVESCSAAWMVLGDESIPGAPVSMRL